jgi:neutral ceramidase
MSTSSMDALSTGTGQLRVGLASVDITPAVGQPMGGYTDRNAIDGGRSKEIHDPLLARVLVLSAGNVTTVIVCIDLLLFSSKHVVAEIKRRYSASHVVLMSTHTHAGPIPTVGGVVEWTLEKLNVDPQLSTQFDRFAQDPWFASVEQRVIETVGRAMRDQFDAKLWASSGELEGYHAHNRRYVHPDGRVEMKWANPNRIPTSPIDPTMRVLKITDTTGKTRALLTHIACHPVVLGGANFAISADFPGPLIARVEREIGDGCLAFFLQGALGDIDPCDMGLAGEHGFKAVHALGNVMAERALQLAAKATEIASGKTTLAAGTLTCTVRERQDPERRADVVCTLITLNDQLAIFSIPAEPFVQHQLDFTRDCTLPHAFLLGMSYSGSGVPMAMYLPTVQAAREGGYGASSVTFLEPSAGEQIVAAAVKQCSHMIAAS